MSAASVQSVWTCEMLHESEQLQGPCQVQTASEGESCWLALLMLPSLLNFCTSGEGMLDQV